MASSRVGAVPAPVDFDLHGLAGVRLIDASPADVAAVSRQLGPIQRPLDREPDVLVRFVDQLELRSPLRYVGPDDAAFADGAFVVLRSKHKARTKVVVPMADVGSRCELVCERGAPAVPLLISILNLTVLHNGGLALHAAAFERDGVGTVATGWSKGGKTESLLAMAGPGVRYVADEWSYLAPDGSSVCGVPEPIRVWDWHLDELGRRREVGLAPQLRLGGLRAADAAVRSAQQLAPRSSLARQLDRAGYAIRRQRHVDRSPAQLFGPELGSLSTGFDLLLFVESVDRRDTVVRSIDPCEVASRMVASLQFERLSFLAHYRMAQFAEPGLRNEVVEQAEHIERDRLTNLLRQKPAYSIQHPYPVRLSELREAIEPLFQPASPRVSPAGRTP